MKNKINLPAFNAEVTLIHSKLANSDPNKQFTNQFNKITPAWSIRWYCRAREYDPDLGDFKCILWDRIAPNAQTIQDALY
jgi:hypothetical protein